jgi:hypothetical protein
MNVAQIKPSARTPDKSAQAINHKASAAASADCKRRTLGGGSTGAAVAIPIFDPIIHAVWANVASKTELCPHVKPTAASNANQLTSSLARYVLVAVEGSLNASA